MDAADVKPAGQRNSSSRQWFLRAALWSALGVHGALLTWQAVGDSPVIDEGACLAAALEHVKRGRFELYRANPPLVRLVAAAPFLFADIPDTPEPAEPSPYVRPEFRSADIMAAQHGSGAVHRYVTLARLACIPISVLGALIAFRWSGELYGQRGAFLTLILWTACPNMLAYGHLITSDAGAATFGTIACFAYWKWLNMRNVKSALCAGASLGLALLSKMTWLILLPLWPAIWCAWRLWERRAQNQPGPPALTADLLCLPLILVTAIAVLNAGYGFEGSLTPIGEFEFISAALTGAFQPLEEPDVGNRFRGTWFAGLAVPLPRNYLRGIDYVKWELEKTHLSYLRGQIRRGGWWYYYLYAMLVKIPVGTLGLIAVSAATMWRRAVARRRDELLLLCFALFICVFVSSQTGYNHHFRYVLPCIPFLYVWAGRLGDLAASPHWSGFVIVVLVVAATISSLFACPHSLSYFNELAGGPRHGHAHLVHSNIDWGQDLAYLKRWLDRHPEIGTMFIRYYGNNNPYDACERLVPMQAGYHPGWYAVSAHWLRMDASLALLLARDPYAMTGYSIYIYKVEADRAPQDGASHEAVR